MGDEAHRLTSREDWVRQWDTIGPQRVGFDPCHYEFRELHALFKRHLPYDTDRRFLEIGAYPGNYIWYFHKYFGYRPFGLEYVQECCLATERHLSAEGVDATLIHADLFEYEPPPDQRWDVVASVGFVEHFSDSTPAIRRHVDLLRPGGFLVLTIPNHHGLNGRLMRLVDPQGYQRHNRMSCDELCRAVAAAGDLTVLEAGYFGRLGFRNSGLYAGIGKLPRLAYLAARAPFWALERTGRGLPNTSLLSPQIAVIARKHGDSERG
jgi:SAM-dependent methyltransferase